MRYHPLSRRQCLQRVGSAAVGAWGLSAAPSIAAVFMTLAQGQQVVAPEATRFHAYPLVLDDELLRAVAHSSQSRIPRGFQPQCWLAMAADKTVGWVMADRVIGKYDAIDYVAGFTTAGAVTALEVLAYRESHGAEIRQAAWRQQFAGRKGPGQLRFGDDIRNISGATLSCQHVTEGMQRLSALVSLLPPMKAGA